MINSNMQLRCNHVDYIDDTPRSLPAEKKPDSAHTANIVCSSNLWY